MIHTRFNRVRNFKMRNRAEVGTEPQVQDTTMRYVLKYLIKEIKGWCPIFFSDIIEVFSMSSVHNFFNPYMVTYVSVGHLQYNSGLPELIYLGIWRYRHYYIVCLKPT